MSPNKLSGFSGEYLDPRMEQSFRLERMDETIWQTRVLLVMSVILNGMFFTSDWRFYGDPHFYVAIPARACVVLMSAGCLLAMRWTQTPARLNALLASWMAVVALAVGLLVSSHSEIAFFVVIMLPAIFYLAVPTTFLTTLLGGAGCSLVLLAGFLIPGDPNNTATGLVLAMVTMNVALAIVIMKGNRLRRLEWSATLSERRANRELAASRKALEELFMAVPIPLVVTRRDDGSLVQANHAAIASLGSTPDTKAEFRLDDIHVDPEIRDRLRAQLDRDGHVSGFEAEIRLPDGTCRDVLLAVSSLDLDGSACIVTGAIDITARKAMEARLEHLATKDPLTQLSNRTEFFEIAEREISRATRHGDPLCVVMIDLDYFKLINDAFGHAAGDQTLKAFAELCRSSVRDHDHLARLGGEEFALLLPCTARDEAVTIAERLRVAVENMKIPDAPASLRVTVSVGVAMVDASERDIHDALARADLALYGAKMRGRNKVVNADEDGNDTPRPTIEAAAAGMPLRLVVS